MILEYLFINKDYIEEVKGYIPSGAAKDISSIDNSECLFVTFSTDSNTIRDANTLSKIHDDFWGKFHPVVIANESSAYYNKVLFPLFNDFERKLRKLLYLKSALNPMEKDCENIKNLEEQDLGKIFELLFSDQNFISETKKKINEKTWKYSKKELIDAIRDVSEDVLWDRLIGYDSVRELRDEFIDVRNYRNDTMHAHNMNMSAFNRAKKLITAVNEGLDREIGKVIGRQEDGKQTESDKKFNEALTGGLEELLKYYDSEEIRKEKQRIEKSSQELANQILQKLKELGLLSAGE